MTDQPENEKPEEETTDKPAKTVKRFSWWLRCSIWFAAGTITTTVVGLVALFLSLPDLLLLKADSVFIITISAGLAALFTLLFAVSVNIRAKDAINWKAYGFLLPFACGIIYPLFAVAIFRRVYYLLGDLTNSAIVSTVVYVALILVLAEFCMRLQPSEGPWYQYTLRSLVIFMAVAGVLFACLGELLVETYKYKTLEAKWSQLGLERNILVWSQGNIRGMIFYDIPDAALKELENVTTLEFLNLNYNKTNFSDSNLESLAHIKHLSLTITGPQVSDLSPLKGLTNLEKLSLDITQVTDLSPLKGLTNLKTLYLYDTPVSKEEVQKLQKALPDCDINWDGN